MIDVKSTGAIGDGVADDSAAFQRAHDALPATGGCIFVSAGVYRIASNAFVISKPGVRLQGEGWSNSIIRRLVDNDGVLIDVTETATAFTAVDLSIFDHSISPTNTGTLLRMVSLNEVAISRCWLQSGYRLIHLAFGSNYEISNCTLEHGRLHAIHGLQAADVRISDSTFYATGAVATDGLGAAAIKIEKEDSHAFRPYLWMITGNTFVNTNVGHNIFAVEVANLGIIGNQWELTGRFNADTYDEIKLESCESVTIAGNTSALEINTYSNKTITGATNASPIVITTDGPNVFWNGATLVIHGVTGNTAANGTWAITPLTSTTFSLNGSAGNGAYTGGGRADVRATRYVVNIDGGCSKVRIAGNTFNRGASGTINDLAADTVIYSSVPDEWPRRFLNGSVQWNMPSTADNAIASTTVTVTGAAVGDPVLASLSTLGNVGALVSAHVISANTILVIVLNKSGGPIDPAAGTLNVVVMKR